MLLTQIRMSSKWWRVEKSSDLAAIGQVSKMIIHCQTAPVLKKMTLIILIIKKKKISALKNINFILN